jgi:hypothetical protein
LRPQKAQVDRVFLRGTIEDPAMLTDLINFLSAARRTGVLTVVCRTLKKSVYFRDGSVIAASSNQAEDRFGDVMYRMGLITRHDLESALQAVSPRMKIGNVLLTRGLLNSRDLWRVIKTQIEEILCSVLLIEEGEFTIAHFDPSQVPTRTAVNTQQILMEGLRRKDEVAHLRDELPAPHRVVTRAGSTSSVTLNEAERRVVDLVDGLRTVAEICAESGLGDFRALRSLYHLIQIGLVTEAADTVLPGEAGGGGTSVGALLAAYNGAFARIHAQLTRDGDTVFTEGVGRFFSELAPEIRPLFEGVSPAGDGRLDPERIQINLKTSATAEKFLFLRRGLSEYLQFMLFLAWEALEFAAVERLAWAVRAELDGFDS